MPLGWADFKFTSKEFIKSEHTCLSIIKFVIFKLKLFVHSYSVNNLSKYNYIELKKF